MFTGFASENTPAIQVWDFFRPSAGSAIRNVSLADDCAPIQYFRTGGEALTMRLYLPSAPIEGKQIKIINSRYGANSQFINIFSSDVSGGGTSSVIITLGQGQTLDLCYSKNFISFGTNSGLFATGWITLNQAPIGATNLNAVVSGGSTNIASASYAFVGGGSSNTASGSGSFVGGGNTNTASGSNSFASGNSTTASGSNSFVGGGVSSIASGTNSFASGSNNATSGNQTFIGGGGSNTASSIYSAVTGGFINTSNADSATVTGGYYGTTRSIVGNTVSPASTNPIASAAGVTQSALLVLGVATTDATATRLRSNTSAAGTANQVILPNNSAYTFQGTCIANVTGGSTTSGWKFEGVIKRGANAASTTLVAAVTPIVIAQDVAAATWVLAITADTTNGGIAVTVTGAAATTIRWVSTIETTEVSF